MQTQPRPIAATGPLRGTSRPVVLGARALNRALLARQLLLQRADMPVADVLEHLVGMQAQAPNPPYFGLWTRLRGFRQDDLSRLLLDRRAVRIALMRSTIHLVTARDSLILRPLMQSVYERGLSGSFGRRLTGLDLEAVAAAGRILVEEQPRTLGELGKLLREQWPDRDPAALANAVRALVPLVQVPPRGIWGDGGQAAHTSAEAWLGQSLASAPSLEETLLRYLAAFGPATVKDMQVWSGLTRLREAIDRLRPRLSVYKSEDGSELFDMPGAPLPGPDTPAPPRFLGEFDNMLLSYADRTRILTDEYRPLVCTENGIVRATILVDGFVRGIWKIVRRRRTVTLVIEPFEPLSGEDCEALAEEGRGLLDFAAADADVRDIQFVSPELRSQP